MNTTNPLSSPEAISAAREITELFNPPSVDSMMDERDVPWLAAIIDSRIRAKTASSAARIEKLEGALRTLRTSPSVLPMMSGVRLDSLEICALIDSALNPEETKGGGQ